MIADLRTATASRIYGSEEAHQLAENEANAARKRQTVRFAVAPRASVNSKRGLLSAGDEIRPEDLEEEEKRTPEGKVYTIPVWRRFETFVKTGVILEKY